MEFLCEVCGAQQLAYFINGEYTPPRSCLGKCRNKIFAPVVQTATAVDWQLFRLQEIPNANDIDAATIPRSVDCEVSGDIVDIVSPGDVILVTGIVKARKPQKVMGKQLKGTSLYILYIEVNSITLVSGDNVSVGVDGGSGGSGGSGGGDIGTHDESSTKVQIPSFGNTINNNNNDNNTASALLQQLQQQIQSNTSALGTNTLKLQSQLQVEEDLQLRHSLSHFPGLGNLRDLDVISAAGLQLTKRDLKAISKIITIPELYRFLVHSFCPSIFGHEIAKMSLLLALIGGETKHPCPQTSLRLRGDIHLLLIGEPGLGKSQLLRYATKIAPRSVYVSGTSATSAGLTATVHREGRGTDYSLDPGALVLADRGICCLDELDKIGTDISCLLEVMEQQTISLAKSGIVCQLPARTSIIAAANPTSGMYDSSKTVLENTKLSGPLLSRFDIVLLLLDKHDGKHDAMMTSHIIDAHGPGGGNNTVMMNGDEKTQQFKDPTQQESAPTFGAKYLSLLTEGSLQHFDQTNQPQHGALRNTEANGVIHEFMRRFQTKMDYQHGKLTTSLSRATLHETSSQSNLGGNGDDGDNGDDVNDVNDVNDTTSNSKKTQNILLNTTTSQLETRKTSIIRSEILTFQQSCGIPTLESRLPLRIDSLTTDPLFSCQPLPITLMSKYIAFVKEFVHPCLTKGAKIELLTFYIDLRKRAAIFNGDGQGNSSGSAPPITTRCIEALIRLTEARARLEARSVATSSDAKDAIDIYKASLFDYFKNDDDNGMPTPLDLRHQFPTKGSKTAQATAFHNALASLVRQQGTKILQKDSIQQMGEKMGMQKQDISRMLDVLNSQGALLMKGPNVYQFLGEF